MGRSLFKKELHFCRAVLQKSTFVVELFWKKRPANPESLPFLHPKETSRLYKFVPAGFCSHKPLICVGLFRKRELPIQRVYSSFFRRKLCCFRGLLFGYHTPNTTGRIHQQKSKDVFEKRIWVFSILLVPRIKNFVLQINSLCYFRKGFGQIVCLFYSSLLIPFST